MMFDGAENMSDAEDENANVADATKRPAEDMDEGPDKKRPRREMTRQALPCIPVTLYTHRNSSHGSESVNPASSP